MGTIVSRISELDNIRWTQPKKGRVMNAKRILFTDETTAIIELENGSYTVAGRRHSANGNWAVIDYGIDNFSQAVLNGLARLGILSREQVKEHIATTKERHAARERKYAIKRLNEICEELGIKAPLVE